jgi:hypothetical protein
MSNEVSITQNINAVEVFKTGGTDEIINKIKQQALSFVTDTTTAKGRKEIASIAARVASSKVALDKAGKELVAGIKEQSKAIDAERKKMRDELDALKIEVRKPLTDWEEAEKAKLEAEQEKKRLEEEAKQRAIFEEQEKKRLELERREAELKAKEDEARRKEEEAKRAQEQKERESQIAKQAELKAKREAEEAIQKAEQEKLRAQVEKEEAEKRAEEEKKKAVEEEKKRQAEEQERIKAEQLRREEDKKHRTKINRQALNDLVKNCDLSEDKAKEIISQIFKKNISNITINY